MYLAYLYGYNYSFYRLGYIKGVERVGPFRDLKEISV